MEKNRERNTARTAKKKAAAIRRRLFFLCNTLSEFPFIIFPTKKKDMVSRVLELHKEARPSIRSIRYRMPPAIYPQYKAGKPNCCMILLRMRFAYAGPVARTAVGSYPAFSPLPARNRRLFSAALSVRISITERAPVITRHPFRRSPDFASHRMPFIRHRCAAESYPLHLLI